MGGDVYTMLGGMMECMSDDGGDLQVREDRCRLAKTADGTNGSR